MSGTPHVVKLLEHPDPCLSLMMVGHLNIEALLTRILEVKLTKPKPVLERAMFAQKVNIAEAIGAIEHDLATVLRKVNSVRNKFAHRLGYALPFEDAFQLVKVAAANGVDFSDDAIHADKAWSEGNYGVEGILYEVLQNTFFALAYAVQDDVPEVLDYLA